MRWLTLWRDSRMKTIARRVTCLAVLSLLARPPIVSGQPPSTQAEEEFAIATTAIEKAATVLPSGAVRFDPRVPRGARLVSRWTEDQIAQLANALHATIAERESVFVCESVSPASCSLQDAAALVALTDPIFHGNRAHVTVTIWSTTGSSLQPVEIQRLSMRLEKLAGSWSVMYTRVTAF